MVEEDKNIKSDNTQNLSNYQKIWGITREIIETVVVVLVLVILIRNFIGEPRWIPSASMRPTLIEGDRLIIEKISGYTSTPKRGDIIVFYPPFESLNQSPWGKFTRLIGYFSSDIAYIKRIVGLPGDLIQIKNGKGVYINGKLLPESYKIDDSIVECSDGMFCGPVRVPKDSYFMMGDNRDNSQDSRFWGFLPKDRVVGKAYFRFWPLNRLGLIERPKY